MSTPSTTASGLRPILLALAMLALAVPAAPSVAGEISWGGERVRGSGHVVQQARALAHFSGVSLALPGSTELRIGNTEGITIEADDNLLALIETVIEGGTLKIRPIRKNLDLESRGIKIVVQAKQVDHLSLGGSGSISSDALRAPKVVIGLGGSGSIDVKAIEADAVTVSMGGSGKLKTGGGAAHKLTVSIGGSGEVQFGQLKTDDASISMAGSGETTVWVRDRLSVSIAGSGDVHYYGDPKISKSAFGSGSVDRLGPAPR